MGKLVGRVISSIEPAIPVGQPKPNYSKIKIYQYGNKSINEYIVEVSEYGKILYRAK